MRVVYAVGTAHVGHVFVRAGTHWPADDPIVQAQPSLFSDDPRFGLSSSVPIEQLEQERPVEQMTAAPGERRNVVRPQADVALDELVELQAEAERRGIKVDRRWSLARLREELAR